MVGFLVDAALVAIIWVVALVFLFRAYRTADDIWLIKHSVITKGLNKRNIWRGQWGETIIASFAALSALVVIFFTRDVVLVRLLTDWRWSIGAVVIVLFVAFWIWRHGRKTPEKAKAQGRKEPYLRRLKATYSIYNFYSLAVFGMGAMIILMLAAQFMHDGALFADNVQRIGGAFAEAESTVLNGPPTHDVYAVAIAQAEGGFSQIALAGKTLQGQFNPMFIFAGTLIVINIVINLTKMKGMFTGDAVSMTALFTYGPLVIIGLIGLLVYLNVYEAMLTTSLQQLRTITPPAALGDWEMSKRHAEMVVELSNARNIFGFAQTIAGEGGGFAILAWGIQTALEKIGENGKDEEPVRMPITRFRPDDGRVPRRWPAEAYRTLPVDS